MAGLSRMNSFLQRVLVSALIIFGIWIAAFFGLRTIHAYSEVRQHRPPPPPFKTDQPETNVNLIEDWMTIPFIARMYHIHPAVLFEALSIPGEANREKSIKQINEKYFPDQPGRALELIKAAVQANLPPPTVLPPLTAVPPATTVPGVSP
jgi:hypothetical protein